MSDLPTLQRPRDTDRERAIIELRLSAPKRSREAQSDHNHLPLFIAGNEPGLF